MEIRFAGVCQQVSHQSGFQQYLHSLMGALQAQSSLQEILQPSRLVKYLLSLKKVLAVCERMLARLLKIEISLRVSKHIQNLSQQNLFQVYNSR